MGRCSQKTQTQTRAMAMCEIALAALWNTECKRRQYGCLDLYALAVLFL
jgi:hypothetical protein